jgi:hypothetical protein
LISKREKSGDQAINFNISIIQSINLFYRVF